jgi:hypothetical protein
MGPTNSDETDSDWETGDRAKSSPTEICSGIKIDLRKRKKI